MENEIAKRLEEAGHPDLAETLKRRDLARDLREHGRDDLAERVEAQGPTGNPTGLDLDALAERSQRVVDELGEAAEAQANGRVLPGQNYE